MTLTDTEVAMLALERAGRRQDGSWETAVRTRFAMTPTQYAQKLARLIDREEALVADPVTVNRLRRLRERRRAG